MTTPSIFAGMMGASSDVDIGDNIPSSLMLDSSLSQYLSRTPSVSGNRKTFTYVDHVKRGKLSAFMGIFSCGPQSSGNAAFEYYANDTITLDRSAVTAVSTTAVYRDPSAYSQIVIAVDTTLSSEKVKIWVNGALVYSGDAGYALNADTEFNRAGVEHNIGRGYSNTSYYFDGYRSNIYWIDGQALTPSSFGRVSADTGQWVPKNYTGTYGANGFILDFKDGTQLGKDTSGNNNHWTLNGGITSANQYTDTPTNNFAVLNPLAKVGGNTALTAGNLRVTKYTASTVEGVLSSIPITGGKTYFEITAVSAQNYNDICLCSGIAASGSPVNKVSWDNSVGIRNNASTTLNATGFVTGDILSFALDWDADTCGCYKNNTLIYTITGLHSAMGVASGTPIFILIGFDGASNTGTYLANFGARPFAYTPPVGFKALCTANLPTPPIPKPKKHFDVVTRMGFGAAGGAIQSLKFKPDFLWSKGRNLVSQHYLMDSIRGISSVLASNTTEAERTVANFYTSLNDNGYTLGTGDWATTSAVVDWAWKAGGAAVTNNAGSIPSQVSANVLAGFSIAKYIANGVTGATFGHGQPLPPELVIIKVCSVLADNAWVAGHNSVGWNKALYFNYTNAAAVTGFFNSTAPTSSVVTLGGATYSYVNNSGSSYVAYCFRSVPDYSKVGSYNGNGSADGPFVYCGFKSRFILVKRTDVAAEWAILDTARSPSNAAETALYPNLSNAEGTGEPVDLLSNGFKPRTTNARWNASGGTYIFYAIAEAPAKYATAR